MLTFQVYLNLTEQGVQALGPSELMPNFFIHAQGRLPNGRQPPIRNTHFEFNEKSQGLSFAAATEIEMQLMTKLLKAGYNVVNGVWPGTYQESQRQERMAEQRERDEMVNNSLRRSMERLRLNTEAVKKENQDESPPQSPKGSLALGESEPIHTPTTRLSPPRRQSEPKPFTGSLGANLDISPFRLTPPIGTNVSPMRSTPTSGSRAIPIKDPNKMHSTPTKAGRRPSFAVGDTIHEESENEDA